MSRKLRVFLCHATQDKPVVWRLHRYLKQHGVQPWLDQEDLLPGQDWRVEIPKAIDSSDVIVVCLSKNSVNKEGYVQAEITFALDKALEKPEGTIFIVPVKLEECDIPNRLGRYQWVDLSRTDGRKRLLMGLNHRAVGLGVDVLPVTMEDARQRKMAPKTTLHEQGEGQLQHEPRAIDRIIATAISLREKKEQEEKEKKASESLEGTEQNATKKTATDEAGYEEREKTFREAAETAQGYKDFLSGIAVEGIPVVGPVEKDVPAPIEYRPSTQPITNQAADSKPKKPKVPVWVMGLLALGLISLSVWGVSQFTPVQAIPTSTPSPTVRPITTIPSATKPPTITPTEAPTEPSLGIGSTMIGKDGMVLVYVPAGDFLMGSTDADSYAQNDEKPQHTVFLDAYWIDQTEVTNAMYATCVSEGICIKEPIKKSSYTHISYYGASEFDNYPVIHVDWYMASTYCKWADQDLPTEAQWEKAARGIDGFIYLMSNEFDGTKVNSCDTNCPFDWANKSFDDGYAEISPVGSYASGRSPYGLYDMAGNVWEWVKDWYDETYYQGSPTTNPLGPNSGQYRVLKGGSWVGDDSNLRFADHDWIEPSYTDFDLGFRCALSTSNP